MPRTDNASRVIGAPPERVYAAFVDPDALTAWLAPPGMAARFGRFDPRPGGSYRLAVDFVSSDPAFAGTMTMTWAVTAVDGGSRVDITADDVPDGISADDHEVGFRSSLANLATYVERGRDSI